MTTPKFKHYDTIIAPVITEKATMASEAGAVVFQVVDVVNAVLDVARNAVYEA